MRRDGGGLSSAAVSLAAGGQRPQLRLLAVAGAWGVPAALRAQAGQAGRVLRASDLVEQLVQQGVPAVWQALVAWPSAPDHFAPDHLRAAQMAELADFETHEPETHEEVDVALRSLCAALAAELQSGPSLADDAWEARPVVLTGDHALAVGSWRGLAAGRVQRPGLLWIDAHLDAHTLLSSCTGNRHGMPLASLLGCTPNPWGLTEALVAAGHSCVLGARSFEPAEWRHLESLGVRVITAEEIRRRGLAACFAEAHRHVSRDGREFGVSLDLDVIDPAQAGAVNTPVADGLDAVALGQQLQGVLLQPACIGVEIAEYNPARDAHGQTRQVILQLLLALAGAAYDMKVTT